MRRSFLRDRRIGENKLLIRFLRDDVDIHSRGIAEKPVDGRHIQILSPAFHSRPPEDHLRDVLFADKCGDGRGHVLALQPCDLRTQVFTEFKIGGK
jgi:hypothetical protein